MTHVTFHVNHVTSLVLVRLVKQKFSRMTRFPTLSVRILAQTVKSSVRGCSRYKPRRHSEVCVGAFGLEGAPQM